MTDLHGDVAQERILREVDATPRPASVTDVHLVFLDQLRDSGVTNMFGARPYLETAFGLPKSVASEVLGYWMRSFEERHPS